MAEQAKRWREWFEGLTPERKAEYRAQRRAYYEAHIEEKRAYDRLRWSEHGDDLRAQMRASWAAKTPEERAKTYEQNRRWREANADKLREQRSRGAEKRSEWRRQDYQRRPEYWKQINERRNLRRYGLTPDEFAELLARQAGVCAVCRQPETAVIKGKPIRLSVDHDHATGRVRGLLCFRCNAMIGTMNDDTDLLRAAVAYLDAA